MKIKNEFGGYSISNKIYNIEYYVHDNHIFLCNFNINTKYQGRKYSYRIFNSLSNKYNKDIILECFPTLIDYYIKLGFEILGRSDEVYWEMILRGGF